MKLRIVILACVSLLVLTSSLVAQSNQETWKTKGFKSPRQDMFMVDLSLERLTNLPSKVEQRFFSRGVSVLAMYDLILGKSNFSLGIGGGFSSQSIFTNALLQKDSTAGPSYFAEISSETNYTKSKIVTNFLELPVEIRYRTTANAKGHSWKIAAGVRVGTLVDVHSKYIDTTGKYKSFIFPDVNELRLAGGFRLGYGRASLSFYRNFNSFFNEGQGAEHYNYSIGLNLAIF